MDNSHVRKINRGLVYGWMLIVCILFVTYSVEVLKGQRSISYLLVFMAFTAVPALIVLIIYKVKPDRYELRYLIVGGYFIMYTFVMLTGSTTMVFSYILPLLSLLVLYHQPMIILVTGFCSIILNFVTIFIRFYKGELTNENSKDAEIQLALLFLCFTASFLAARLYDGIQKTNDRYNEELSARTRDIERMTLQTITTIANTIDAKDEYTRGHSKRVAEYSAAIAQRLGLSEIEVSNIRFIGLLHDIGKIGIPDAVLNKPGKLTTEEYQVMKGHTTAGADILKDIDMINGLDIGAKYHHERLDGKGYPDGLVGDEIPLIARIIAVADAYDAMSSNRVYRRHLPKDKILAELENGKGTQWDPECTDVMIQLIKEDKLPKVNPDVDSEMVQQASTILSRVIDLAEDRGNESADDLDDLTGTYGRDRGKIAIQSAIERCGCGCLLVFDIDHFHKINDVEGFIVGDVYLKTVVELIRGITKNQIISRFGADEFVVYMPEVEDTNAAQSIAQIFLENVHHLAANDVRVKKLSVSIGITEIATEKDKIMVLYEHANKALYVAKQQGGDAYYCHRPVYSFNEEVSDPAADLKNLVGIIQNREHYKGGLIAAYPEFGKMYEFISSLAQRNHMLVQIVLFTVNQAPDTKTTLEDQYVVMELLQKAIVNSIRNVDVTTRYSNTQLAILLMNLNDKEVKNVINRIMTEFLRTYDKGEFTVHYDTADLSKE